MTVSSPPRINRGHKHWNAWTMFPPSLSLMTLPGTHHLLSSTIITYYYLLLLLLMTIIYFSLSSHAQALSYSGPCSVSLVVQCPFFSPVFLQVCIHHIPSKHAKINSTLFKFKHLLEIPKIESCSIYKERQYADRLTQVLAEQCYTSEIPSWQEEAYSYWLSNASLKCLQDKA